PRPAQQVPAAAADAARTAARPGDAPTRRRAADLGRTATDTARTIAANLPFPVVDEPVEEIAVRVLDRVTRKPVPSAEVLYLPFQVDYVHTRARGDRALQEMIEQPVFLEQYGARTQTDADGLATIALPRSGGRVLARFGERTADASIDPAD